MKPHWNVSKKIVALSFILQICLFVGICIYKRDFLLKTFLGVFLFSFFTYGVFSLARNRKDLRSKTDEAK